MISSRNTYFLFIPIWVLLIGNIFPQVAPITPHESIQQLIDELQHDIRNGSPLDPLFSPNARVTEKTDINALSTQGFLSFQIVGYTLKDLHLQDERHASLSVTIKWSTQKEEVSKTTTIRFVKEQDAWYFENAGFWKASVGWFFFPLIGLAIAYGISAVVMNRHIERQQWARPGKKILWHALSIIPLFALFYFVKRPWNKATA